MWKIPLFKIYHNVKDNNKINDILNRKNFWANGPEINEFEQKLAEFVGTKYAVAFNSGTSSLHAILLAMNIKEKCKVAVPSFTFIATANSTLFVNAEPVFVDIEEETLGMDPKHLNQILKENKIDVIIPVHYAGNPCKIKEIIKIAKKRNIPVIEDAAESLGTKINGENIGSFGNASVLSFAQNKIITTGEGGAVLTNSKKIYEKLLLIRSHGRNDNSKYFTSSEKSKYVELGYNFRMSSMTAALGIMQLHRIEKIIKLRQNAAKKYQKLLKDIEEVELLPFNEGHVFQLFSIRIKNNKRDKLLKHLNSSGIMTKIYFEPIHLTSFYKTKFGFKEGFLPTTEKISSEIISLPIYPDMNNKEIEFVVKEVRKFFGR